ncbi:MAG: TIGR00159 family protein [Acidobacteria bacterium]|nr:MAG: TIGR00159 family protein [Acidobacteriota bacterium]
MSPRRIAPARRWSVCTTCGRRSIFSRCSKRLPRGNDEVLSAQCPVLRRHYKAPSTEHRRGHAVNWYERLLSLQFTWRDAVDVIVVAFIIYSILALIRGTRAMQIAIGLAVLVSTFFVARAFDLPALEAISREILFYLPFAIIVLFQHEIRRALARMGSNPLLAFLTRGRTATQFEPVVRAVEILSEKHFGALLAIERAQSLRMVAETAKPIDALISTELLVSIFTPGGPLHDGAVIIRGNRVIAAGAFLPLTASTDPKLGHGTRHRAALGLSEESDALVIVVSEENGSVAVAREGALTENLDAQALTRLLEAR